MVLDLQRPHAHILRLIGVLVLLGRPGWGYAQQQWSAISLPLHQDAVYSPTALAVDTGGNLYLAEMPDSLGPGDIQQRDHQGNWAVIATFGLLTALAVDAGGNLFVAANGEVHERDARGNWSKLATFGEASGQVYNPAALAVDGAGNLYVAELGAEARATNRERIQKRDVQGNWSTLTPAGTGLKPYALAVDADTNLYVAYLQSCFPLPCLDGGSLISGISPYDEAEIATAGTEVGHVSYASALAIDGARNLYVSDRGPDRGRIQRRDAQGNWAVVASSGSGLGQVVNPTALAMDAAGNLYVADTGNHRILLKYTPSRQ